MNKTYKETAEKQFRYNVIREYDESINFGYLFLSKIIGEIVVDMQHVEFTLQKLVKSMTGKEERNSKKNLTLLEARAVSMMNKNENVDKIKNLNSLIRKLKNVIECRHWLIHTSVLEFSDKQIALDELFVNTARSLKIFDEDNIKKLEENIDSKWQVLYGIYNQQHTRGNVIEFNRDEKSIIDRCLSYRMDWVIVKAVITKYLIHELSDVLSNNPMNIYSER